MLPSCLSAPSCAWSFVLCLWKDGASEIFGGRGCPFCPPHVCTPVEGAQRTLPFGVILAQESLCDPAGKLQRCLSPCWFSLSLQKQHAFLLSIYLLHWVQTLSNDVVETNLCWVLRFEVDHAFGNIMLPMFRGMGYVHDGVAVCKRCETTVQE